MDIMPRSVPRTYSRYCREAAVLLGSLIRTVRKERGLAAREVAERAGISLGDCCGASKIRIIRYEPPLFRSVVGGIVIRMKRYENHKVIISENNRSVFFD